MCAPEGHLLVPRMTPEDDLVELEVVTKKVLKFYGFMAGTYCQEPLAKAFLDSDTSEGFYPLLLSQPDTDGEKSYPDWMSFIFH